MEKFVQHLQFSLEAERQRIEATYESTITIAREAAKLYGGGLMQLHEFISGYRFKSAQEEIHFFKNVKPGIQKQLIYYSKVCDIEGRRPIGSIPVVKEYLIGELNHLKRFFDKNAIFYKYFRLGSNDMDSLFFLRAEYKDVLLADDVAYEKDPRFSTPCDFKMAKMMANQDLIAYLNQELHKLEHPELGMSMLPRNAKWTGYKIWLIELAYSLYCSSVVNNGNSSIIDIVKILEAAFSVDLSNCYGMFSDIRNRKKNPTLFLDKLKEQVLKKIDEPLAFQPLFPH